MPNNCDPHVLCAQEKNTEPCIVLDVDLEGLIRESERLRICEVLYQSCEGKSWALYDLLTPIIGVPRVLTVPEVPDAPDMPDAPDTPPEADHAE